ncbi:MAG: YibE/F family protein [Clostridia bacterium]|nr:YibE/F family protein [Clostridia bacterium]
MKKSKRTDLIAWILTVVLSIVFVVAGNRIAGRDMNIFQNFSIISVKARVVDVADRTDDIYTINGENYTESTLITFTAEILNGDMKGQTVDAVQQIDHDVDIGTADVKKGDRIVLYRGDTLVDGIEWSFGEFVRIDKIIIMVAVFFLLLIVFGGKKGVNTIISLIFTCLAVFLVFVPSVLSGYNIYVSTVIICVFTIIMTLILTNGVNRKTASTILGCTFGVLTAAGLFLLCDMALRLTGFISESSMYLLMLKPDNPISLKAVIFGGVVIGAMGAVMDVAMDISSSLYEVKRHAPGISFGELVKSGIRIGRDIMGTMANTLVLAYIGSSLTTVLLLITYATSVTELFNREEIITEFTQAIIGSTAILLTVPLTAIVCGLLYGRLKAKDFMPDKEEDEEIEIPEPLIPMDRFIK